MIEPIKYEIPFIMPNKEKLEEYNKHLYNLDELITSKSTELEQKMYDYIQKKSNKKRMILGRKGYSLIFRLKTLLIHHIYDLTFRETENMIKENISVRVIFKFNRLLNRYNSSRRECSLPNRFNTSGKR